MFPLISLIRFLVPLSIFIHPLIGIAICAVADMYDWMFVHVSNQSEYNFYQHWDKFFDTYYLAFACLTLRYWKDAIAKRVAFSLFLYRLVGVIAYYVTDNRQLLFFFPNFFENFFIMYLVFKHWTKTETFILSSKILIVVMISIVFPKLFHELYLHIYSLQPWQVYDVGKLLQLTGLVAEYTNYFVWGSILYVLPLSTALWYVRKQLLNQIKSS